MRLQRGSLWAVLWSISLDNAALVKQRQNLFIVPPHWGLSTCCPIKNLKESPCSTCFAHTSWTWQELVLLSQTLSVTNRSWLRTTKWPGQEATAQHSPAELACAAPAWLGYPGAVESSLGFMLSGPKTWTLQLQAKWMEQGWGGGGEVVRWRGWSPVPWAASWRKWEEDNWV